jgi:hypothetical protein
MLLQFGTLVQVHACNQRRFAPGIKGFDCSACLPAEALREISSTCFMRRNNFALRLQPPLLGELGKIMIGNAPYSLSEWDWLKIELRLRALETRGRKLVTV